MKVCESGVLKSTLHTAHKGGIKEFMNVTTLNAIVFTFHLDEHFVKTE